MTPAAPSDPPVRLLELAEGPVAYTDEGRGATVVALHGLPGSSRDFRYLGALCEGPVRFLRLDLPGFGATPLGTMPNPSFPARAAFVRRVLDGLDLGPVVLLAHSVGGPLAIEIAASFPERVAGLALLASVGMRPHQLLRRSPLPPAVASRALRTPLVGRALMPALRRLYRLAGFPASTPDVSLVQTTHCAAALDFPRFARNIARLRAPTLVAWATDDALVEDAIGRELDEACPEGPRLRFAEGGHNIQKTRATELCEALSPWVTSLGLG